MNLMGNLRKIQPALIIFMGLALLLSACSPSNDPPLTATPTLPEPIDVAATSDSTGQVTPGSDRLVVAPPRADLFPPPQLCGDNPPLTPLQFGVLTQDPDLPGVYVRRAAYNNDRTLDQEWEIVVRAGSVEALNRFTADGALKVCAEAVPGFLIDPEKLAELITPSRYPIILLLLAETSAQTGAPAIELSQRSEAPRVIIVELGGNPDAVVGAVIQSIKEAQQADNLRGVDPDWLTAFEADSLGAVNALLDESGLFFGVRRADSRPLGQILAEEPQAVAVELRPAGQLAEDFQAGQGGVIAYLIDPDVAPGAPNYYVAHCTTYAYAQASLVSINNNGTLSLVLRKVGTGSQSSTASAAAPNTQKLEDSNRTGVTFDVEVSATANGSYTIAGNWAIGTGGACVNQ